MASRRTEPTPGSETGLKEEFRAFLDDASSHLRTRGELFGIEAKEAAASCSRKFALAAFGFGTLAVGYLLVIASLVGIIGSLFAGSDFSLANWTGAALLLGIIHLVLAFLILQKARKAGKDAALFEYTLAELRKDQQWLNREKNN